MKGVELKLNNTLATSHKSKNKDRLVVNKSTCGMILINEKGSLNFKSLSLTLVLGIYVLQITNL